jgi:DNA-binding beta-propeller fold protein YncE
MRRSTILFPVLFLTLSVLSAQAQSVALTPPAPPDAGYNVLKTQTVGGEGGYDYVATDSTARRLYVARTGPKGALAVYDMDSLAPVGKVKTGSAHGAAIDPELHHGFATSKPVTMFDTQTLKVIKKIDTGGDPDGYLADTATHRIYILSHTAPNVTVLDAHDGAILGTVDLSGEPEQAQLDNKGHLFINLEDKAAIAVVDTATLKLTGKYDLSSEGGGCAGLAFDPDSGILFAACRDKNNMIMVKADDGTIVKTLPIGAECDGAVYNPDASAVFSAQEDGTMTVIHVGHYSKLSKLRMGRPKPVAIFSLEQTIATPRHARTLALDTKTGNI